MGKRFFERTLNRRNVSFVVGRESLDITSGCFQGQRQRPPRPNDLNEQANGAQRGSRAEEIHAHIGTQRLQSHAGQIHARYKAGKQHAEAEAQQNQRNRIHPSRLIYCQPTDVGNLVGGGPKPRYFRGYLDIPRCQQNIIGHYP